MNAPAPTASDRRRARRRGRFAASATVSMAIGAVALSLAGCGTTSSLSSVQAITVTQSSCASEWHTQTGGSKSFSVTNDSSDTMDVQLLNAKTDRVIGEIVTLGPKTTRPLSATIGSGTYTWQCGSVDGAIVSSNPEKIDGAKVAPTPSYQPTTPDTLDPAVEEYRTSITQGMAVLSADTDKLLAAVTRGDLTAAKQAWLVAHLDYARLGAAYDTFGDFDGEINGRADGLPGGVNNPDFTGFLRLEYALWHGQPQSEVLRVTQRLDTDVHGLEKAFPHQIFLDTDLPLRGHEILENAMEFELTGDSDEGSHTDLATLSANLDGTQTVFSALRTVLLPRDPTLLATIEQQLGQLSTLVATYDQNGHWVPLDALTRPQREEIDAQMDGLLQNLSAIPGTLRIFTLGAD